MKRLAIAGALLAVWLPGAAVSADGPTRDVTMPGKAYEPPNLEVLVGTTVTWHNDDTINHTVTAEGDAFDSGFIPPGGSFSFTFDRQGSYAFHCTIHKFMRGEVRVFGLVLVGPDDPVTVGRRVALTGLAPAGTASVIVRSENDERTVKPRADGSFALGVRVTAPARYRATTGRLTSRAVDIFARPVVRASRSGRLVRASATPGRPGAKALLQAYDRDHFAWRTLQRAKLDARSRVSFAVGRDPARLRVLVRGDGGWADAVSPTLLAR